MLDVCWPTKVSEVAVVKVPYCKASLDIVRHGSNRWYDPDACFLKAADQHLFGRADIVRDHNRKESKLFSRHWLCSAKLVTS